MARIERVSAGDTGLRVKLAYFFTRRHLARLRGASPSASSSRTKIYAHTPGLMSAYGKIEEAAAKQDRVA